MNCRPIRLRVGQDEAVSFRVSQDEAVTFRVGAEMIGNIPKYDGPYEITPSGSEQILPVNGLKMTQNLKVKPVPNNYGLIGWNGSVLTVT